MRPGRSVQDYVRHASDPAGRKVLAEQLLPLATVVTPNVDEAAALTDLPVTNTVQMRPPPSSSTRWVPSP